MDEAAHFQHSTLRERIVEHVFVGDALRTLWGMGVLDVEVLRSEFDAHGYDLVMARGRIVRHIQFKTGTSRKPGDVSVSQALALKPSGCVIWMRVTAELAIGPYFWFGAAPERRCRQSTATQILCVRHATKKASVHLGRTIGWFQV